MSYIGAEPTTAAFPFDQFSGTGAATSFTLTYAPAGPTSILVAISGVMQNPNLYSVIGTTLSFSPAPPAGTNNISVLYLGLPVIGSTSPGNTAFLSSTDLTATAGQTVFASAGSYTPGFVQVYRNGARLGNADFTATNGTTITLAVGAAAGDLVTIEYYTLTSLVNALPLTGGTVTGSTTFNTGVNLAAVSGNVGIGTTSPTFDDGTGVQLSRSGTATYRATNTSNSVSLEMKATNSLVAVSSRGNYPLIFETNGTERARIDSSGNLLVGTTSGQKRVTIDEPNNTTGVTYGLKITNSSSTTNTRAGVVLQNYDNNSAAIWSPRTGASTGALVFGTNGGAGIAESNIAERVRIDSNGFLTAPYQPSFWAATTGCTRNATTGAVQGYPTPYFNQGGYFNTTTGYFTAPVAGVYAFTGSKYNMGAGSGTIGLFVNGSQRAYNDFNNNSGSVGTHPNVILYYKLASGDTVFLGITASFNAGDSNDYFGGYLVS